MLPLEVERQQGVERFARLALAADLGLEVGLGARESQEGGILVHGSADRGGQLRQPILLAPQDEERDALADGGVPALHPLPEDEGLPG